MRRAWIALALCGGCQSRSEPTAAPSAADAEAAAEAEPIGPGDAAEAEPAEVGPSAAPDPDDEAAEPAAGDLGAIPAWRAVIDRARYLARRGDRGVVAGRVGDPVEAPGELVWLIDETEGNGALAIRVRFAQPPRAGARVAVRGAWTLDERRRWIWQADAVTPLPAAETAVTELAAQPGHVIASMDPPGGSSKTRAPDKVSPGEVMVFTVVEPPRREGDGWGVSDRKWGTILATVRLPGEHDSYGGHDLRAADERWALVKGGTYWVRVGKVRRPASGVPVIQAVTAPARFP